MLQAIDPPTGACHRCVLGFNTEHRGHGYGTTAILMIEHEAYDLTYNVGQNAKLFAVYLCLTAFGSLGPGRLCAETFSRTNKTSIAINDDGTNYSTANPYPSTISASGLTQQVAHVSVTLWGLNHAYTPDISILLVGPMGQSVVLMSQVGEGFAVSVNWLTLDDSAKYGLPYIGRAWSITNGIYKPTDGQSPNYNFFPRPAPGTNTTFYSTTLSAFDGTSPNGTWSLYVDNEETTGDTGSIPSGWTLNLVTAPFYDGVQLNDTNQLLADWDGDGMPNVLEYALGTDPKNPADSTAGATPSIAGVSGNNYLQFKYKQRVDAASLQIQYVPEVSSDKTNWSSDNSHVVQIAVTAFDSEFNWVTVRDLTPITSSGPQFVRLRIVYNSIQATSPVLVGSDTLVHGNGGSGSKLTLFTERMVQPVAYAGIVSSVQDTLLIDTNSAWGEGQFGTNGTPSYVEFNNGWSVDIANSSAASNTLIVASSLTAIANAVGRGARTLCRRPALPQRPAAGAQKLAGNVRPGRPLRERDLHLQLRPGDPDLGHRLCVRQMGPVQRPRRLGTDPRDQPLLDPRPVPGLPGVSPRLKRVEPAALLDRGRLLFP